MATTQELTTWISEAETARHRLMTGSKEVRVEYQGKYSVTYTETKLADLDRYIQSLKSQLNVATGSSGRGRAIRVNF